MTTSPLFPSMVLVIRHGEKPGSPNGKDGGPHLSLMGSARAAALPSLFTPDYGATPVVGAQLCCAVSSGSAGQFVGITSAAPMDAGASRFPTTGQLVGERSTQYGQSRRVSDTNPR